jgi:hypothetical protein
MRSARIADFELLQHYGGGCNGAVFLVRCKEATGNPFWRCVLRDVCVRIRLALVTHMSPRSRHGCACNDFFSRVRR